MQAQLRLDQPDLTRPERARVFAFGSGTESIGILNARGRTYEGGGDEPELSLKWIPHGEAHYQSEGSHFALEGNAHLLLNRGQPYRLTMARESESFVLFYSRGLANSAWAAVTGRNEAFVEVPSVAGLSQP